MPSLKAAITAVVKVRRTRGNAVPGPLNLLASI